MLLPLRSDERPNFHVKVLTAKEFTDGFNLGVSDLIFQFVNVLISSCHTEVSLLTCVTPFKRRLLKVVSLYELVVRVLMARLESKPSSGRSFEQVDSAFKLLKTLVEETSMEALSGPQKEILKFQVEQV